MVMGIALRTLISDLHMHALAQLNGRGSKEVDDFVANHLMTIATLLKSRCSDAL